MLERKRIVCVLCEMETESRALKRVLRARWEEPMADRQRRLVVVRRRATELCVALAAMRGRLHVVRAPRDLPEGATWDAEAYRARVVARLEESFGAAAAPGERAS
jgi:hypothetical protein